MEFFYRCSECDRQYAITPDIMVCPECSRNQEDGQPLRGVLEVRLSGEARSSWPESSDYSEFLPVPQEFFPPVPVGNTPMWEPTRIRESLGLRQVFLKDDTANPTGSLKDRASMLVAAFARRHGIRDIVVASTGNAASSMAGIGAASDLRVKVFVPGSAPRAKLVQSLQYGADVTIVDGSYDDAFSRSLSYSRENGGLSRNTAYNPLTIEGKKTVALEIFARIGVPDIVYVPTGDGVILGGVYKGFEDLVQLGLADRMPTVVAAQAAGSNAISRAVRNGGFAEPVAGSTVADSISVAVPANGIGAAAKLGKYGGRCVEVTDDEILDAQHMLASMSGLFAEPAASAAYAGLLKESDRIGETESVVVLITGSGLKDIDAAGRRMRIG